MSKYLYKLQVDISRDALNWYDACNGTNMQGRDWTIEMDPVVVKTIKGLDKITALEYLVPYLQRKYEEDAKVVSDFCEFAMKEFNERFEKGCEKLKAVMGGRELYRNDFTLYVTTIRRCPYNKKDGSLYVSVLGKNPMSIFLHELCHFQFIHYWKEDKNSPVSKLSPEEFNYIKESLTMILDEDFIPIINKPDNGYPKHYQYRSVLKEFWAKNKNFDELVKYGLQKLPSFINT